MVTFSLREVTLSYINAYTCAQDLLLGGYLPCKKYYKVWYFSKERYLNTPYH